MFEAGEREKKHRKNPAQMLEALQQAHPGALDLPEHGGISSYIGSLVARKKQGKVGPPKSRAIPVSENQKKAIQATYDEWDGEDPKHKVIRGGSMKTFIMSDIYRHLRAAYDKQFRIPNGAKFKKLFEGEPFPGKTTNFNDEDNS